MSQPSGTNSLYGLRQQSVLLNSFLIINITWIPNMSRYWYVLMPSIVKVEGTNSTRWLWRRGAPLPIPNRTVKPASADGTAIQWESRSPPFLTPLPLLVGEFFLFTIIMKKSIIKSLQYTLNKSTDLLTQIDSDSYINNTVGPFYSSVGSHIRHTLDFLNCISNVI